MAGCAALIIAGGALQVLGFVFVAWELWRVQQREFGTPQSAARAQRWLRRWILRRRPETHIAEGAAALSARATLRARGRREAPEGASIERRLATVEANLLALDTEVAGHGDELERQRSELQSGLAQIRAGATGNIRSAQISRLTGDPSPLEREKPGSGAPNRWAILGSNQ